MLLLEVLLLEVLLLEVLELKASMKLRLLQPLEEGRRVQRRRAGRATIWKVG